MSTIFKDDFVDCLLAEGEAKGKAEGEAAMLLRIMTARGFALPASIRDRVRSCTDTEQLETWADRAVTAGSVEDIFAS